MIAEILGRFHPLIVHLPVGILILAFLMELAGRRERYAKVKVALPFVLQVAVLTALFALLTGWIMPKEGSFDERLIGLHFWSSVSMTVASIALCYLSYQKDCVAKKLYFPMFIMTMILLTVTGHYGGSLTHGEGHLTGAIERETKTAVTDVNTLGIYADLITPIFKKKCYSCHNEGKKKGELVMSNTTALMKGGAEGPIIVKGDLASSSLLQRVHLPEEEDAHMPPKGKVQLTKNEIKLIEWWIAKGADFEKKVGDTKQTEEITTILKGYEQSTSKLDPSKVELLAAGTIASLSARNITVIPESETSPFAYVSLQRDTTLSSGKLKKLKSLAKNITELDLSFTNMDDGMMSQLVNFKNLQTLKLQHTQVSSKGLKHLEKLEHLSSLNLYNTPVDDEGFASIRKMSALSALFLWQTKVTDEAVKTYAEEKPLVQVSYKIDQSLFGDARLKPPIITAEKDIFEDSLAVTMTLNFKNVNVYYTLDGTEPDSASMKYDSTFYIHRTAAIKAISAKGGWTTSEPSEKVLIKAGHTIASAKLAKAPNEKYAARGAKSLIDFEKGSTSFVDGKWLGYEGENMTATLDLGTTKELTNVVVGALEETGSYIFFPKGIVVKTSIDGSSFTSTQQLDIPITKGPEPGSAKSFLLEFEKTTARYVQVQVLGTLKNPQWHAAPGARNWVFIDEILVN